MARRYDTVTLLTDYGTDDESVGVLKSVIREVAPHVVTIDLTHEIRPYDVRAGALALARAIPYVVEGIVVAVVDPGVGTTRKAVAIEVADGAGVLVGPDNGLLAPAIAVLGGAGRAVELTAEEFHLHLPTAGVTFAGRDVFAPAAAHLATGVDLADLGTEVDPALLLPGMVPLPRPEGDELHTEVLWVDRFGNCQLNVSPHDLAEWQPDATTIAIVVGDTRRAAKRAATYAELGVGTIGLVVDSHGMCSLCLDQRSASAELQIAQGDAVVLTPFGDDAQRTPVPTPVDLQRRDRLQP